MKNFAAFCLAAAAVAPLAAPAAPAPPPTSAIMAPVKGAVEAINADRPSALDSYFTPDAVVVDNVRPFRWTGPGAAKQWLIALDGFKQIARIKQMSATTGHPGQIVWDHDRAYVVVPISIDSQMAGEPHHSTGLWALTLTETAGSWKITSASWAAKP